MPLKKCTEGGQSGWRWGNTSKCWTGPDAKKNCIRQAIKIEGPDKFKKIMEQEKKSKGNIEDNIYITKEDVREILLDKDTEPETADICINILSSSILDRLVLLGERKKTLNGS